MQVAMMFLSTDLPHHKEMWRRWFKAAAGMLPRASVQKIGCDAAALATTASTCAVPEAGHAIEQQHLFTVYLHIDLNNKEFKGMQELLE